MYQGDKEAEVLDPSSEGNDIDDGEQFEVEDIVRRRGTKDKGFEYLVKWKGFDESENTWELESNLEGAMEAIETYKIRMRERKKGRESA